MADVTITAPPNDTREYRYFELENGLKAVVVSDPASEKAAAALDMGVGQMTDPEDVPGLAHFLEHMLFLGSEKYPGDDEYSSTLALRGGRSNAYTALQDTNYFFDVRADALAEILDIFANFFVAPLFTADATGRELNAVDSEHNKNLQQDVWRRMQLMRTTADPGYSFAKFGTGSRATLEPPPESGIDVRKELLDFHAKYYSASIATVAVLGTESLDELEALVRTTFGGVPSSGRTRPVHVASGTVDPTNAARLPYGDGGIGKWFSVVPVADARSIQLNFPIAPMLPHYKTRPDSLLGHLFGHESEGSILAALKARGLATGLSAGRDGMGTDDFDIFAISIELTDDGEAALDEVVATVFAYVGMLASTGAENLAWVHDELTAMGKVAFATKEKSQPMNAVLGLAGDLQHVAPEHVLSHSTLFLDPYDPAPVADILAALTPSNVRIIHMSKSVAGVATEAEKWYGTAYAVRNLTDSETVAWGAAASGEGDAHATRGLALPQPNVFVPDDLTVKKLADPAQAERYAPVVIEAGPFGRVWHKQDNVFYVPKASVCLLIRSPLVYASPRSVVLSVLAINMMKEQLNPFTYYAEVAGLKAALAYDPAGIILQLHGVSQKLPKLLDAVVAVLASPDLSSDDVFAAQKDKVTRAYLNARTQQPYMHALNAAKAALIEPEWSSEEKLAVIGTVTRADVVAHAAALFSSFSIEALVHGNVTPEEARGMVAGAVEALAESYGSLPLPLAQSPSRRVVSLAHSRPGATTPVAVAQPGPNPDDVNSAIYSVFQHGPTSPDVDVAVALVGQMVKQPAFHSLRTQQQLGYIVDVSSSDMVGIRGVRAVIQSSAKPPVELDAALDAALAAIRADLADMSDADFAEHVAAVRLSIAERDKQLAQETNRFWGEITKGFFVFDRVSQQLAALDALDRQAALDLFDAIFLPARKLSGWIYGAAHADALADVADQVVDPISFRRSAFLFPADLAAPQA